MCLYLINCVFPSIFSYPVPTSDCLIISITSLAFQNPQNLKMSAGVAGLQDKLNKSLNQKGMVSPYLSRSRRMDKFLLSPKRLNKLLPVGRSERKVWQNDWEEGQCC